MTDMEKMAESLTDAITVRVPVKRFEQLLDAEIRLDILKKTLSEKTGLTFVDKDEVKKILGMEVLKGE